MPLPKITKADLEEIEGFENLRRFLRKHRNNYHNELTYSVTLKKWKKGDDDERSLYRYIKKLDGLWPSEINDICNMLLTLEEHFDYIINIDNFRICVKAQYLLQDEIRQYYGRIAIHRHQKNLLPLGIPSAFQALKEQRARGFKKRSRVKVDRRWGYVESTVDKRYIYPKKFPFDASQKQKTGFQAPDIYRAGALIGVRGWTRCKIPNN